MSSPAESAEVKTEQLLGEEDEDEDEDESVQVSLGYNEDPVLRDPGLSPGVHPGVTLVGRKVQESDVRETNGKLEVFSREGTVVGSVGHEHLGRVYDVRYSDGKRREAILEELLLILWRDESLVSPEIKEARERAKRQKHPGLSFVGTSKVKRSLLGNGVRKDDDLRNKRTLYYASASVTHAATRTFDMLFNKPEGAAAAFDLLVRRLHAVATRTRKANKNDRRCLVKFHRNQIGRLNFPKATASDLCGIVRACKAGEADFASAEELRVEDRDETGARKKQKPNPPSSGAHDAAKGKGKVKGEGKGKPKGKPKPKPKGADSGSETATASGGAAARRPDTSRIADDFEFLRSQLASAREMVKAGDISEADYERIKSHLFEQLYPETKG
jgi:hypothetical protein